MTKRIKVALFCDYYLPGYKAGGPTVSLARIVAREPHCDIRIVTRDRDPGENQPYEIAQPRTWHPADNAVVAYLRPGLRDWWWLMRDLRAWEPDVAYVNSLQSPWYSLVPQLLRRLRLIPAPTLLIAPRGESSSGARSLKHVKKSLARPLIRQMVGHNVTWHTSSHLETADLAKWWGSHSMAGHRVIVEADPPPSPAEVASRGSMDHIPLLVFASRIDRMKGLDLALRALQNVETPCTFRVHGVIREPDYWLECMAIADKLPKHVHFEYAGPYRPTDAVEILAQADLFVLPTKGENFGHAIAEALSVGCPVAISSNTIWTEVAIAGHGFVTNSASELTAAFDISATRNTAQQAEARRAALTAYETWYLGNRRAASLFEADAWVPLRAESEER